MLKTEYELDRIIGGGYVRGNICLHENIATQALELFSPMDNRIATHNLGTIRQAAEGTNVVPGSGRAAVSSWMSYHNISCFDVTQPVDTASGDQLLLAIAENGFGLFANVTKDIALETVAFHPTTCVVRFSHPFVEESSAESDSHKLDHNAPAGLPGRRASYFVAVGTKNGDVSIYTTPKDGLLLFQSVRMLNRYRGIFSRAGCASLEWSQDNVYILAGGGDSTARLLPREKTYDESEQTANYRGRELITTFATQYRAVVGAYFVYTADEKDPYVLIVAADRRAALWKRSSFIPRKDAERWKFEARTKSVQEAHQESEETTENKAEEDTQAAESPELSHRLLRNAWDQQWKAHLRSERTDDDEKPEDVLNGRVSATAFAPETKTLIAGLDDGTLALFRLDTWSQLAADVSPLTCLHVVSVACHPLTSLQTTLSGNLIAIGVPRSQTLMVYDWRREVFSFTRQGHVSSSDAFGASVHNMITSVAYSSDGRFLITGGNDGRIKVWEAESGQCTHTFIGAALKSSSDKLSENTEHSYSPYLSAGITALLGGSKSNAFYALTADGVIRGYDLVKGLCFRVFTVQEEILTAEPAGGEGEDATKVVPKMITISPTFTCMALDLSEEVLIAATDFVGGSPDASASVQSSYYIYIFSTQTGAVMERLSSGHTAPITSINFHPSGVFFATTSWDSSAIVWKLFASGEDGESDSYGPSRLGKSYANARLRPVIIEQIPLNAEGLSVEFADDGQKMSVLNRDGEVYVVACERMTGVSIAAKADRSDAIEPWEIISAWNARRDAEGGWMQRSVKTPMVSTMRESKKNYYSGGNVNPIVRRDASIAFFDEMRFTPSSVGLLLAGKNSRFIVLYHVTAGSGTTGAGGGVLLRKWNVSQNRSICGNIDLYPWRKRKGTSVAALGAIEDPNGFFHNVDHLEEDRTRRWAARAGKRLDYGTESSNRYSSTFHTQIHNRQEAADGVIGVHTLLFANNGDEWVAATPSGVLVFALPGARHSRREGLSFRPLEGMTRDCSVDTLDRLLRELSVQSSKKEKSEETRLDRHVQSILIALTLRLTTHAHKALSLVPREHIRGVIGRIPQYALSELIAALISAFQLAMRGAHAGNTETAAYASNVERILLWVRMVLVLHGPSILKQRGQTGGSDVTMANRMHRLAMLFADFASFGKIVEENASMLDFLCSSPAQGKAK